MGLCDASLGEKPVQMLAISKTLALIGKHFCKEGGGEKTEGSDLQFPLSQLIVTLPYQRLGIFIVIQRQLRNAAALMLMPK